MADDYRLFAALVSPVQDERSAAVVSLPPRLHCVPQGSLVKMAIRLGQVCRTDPIKNVRRESASRLPHELLADIVTTGSAMLSDWPASFVKRTNSAFAERLDDLVGYHAVRAGVRRLGNERVEDASQVELVREAMPNEFSSFSRSSADDAAMTGLDLRSIINLKPRQLQLVREGLEARRLPGRARTRSQYCPEKARSFEQSYRSSLLLSQLTFDLMLPRYALEQMVCVGLLTEEDNELAALARGGTCVTAGSVEDLGAQLRRAKSRAKTPKDAVPLINATRCIGGREKPWAAIFDGLKTRDLDFWIAGERVSTRTIRARPADLRRFQSVPFRHEDFDGFPFAELHARCEIEEVLNVNHKILNRIIDNGHLAIEKSGRRHVAARNKVLELAGRMCSFSELSAHTGWHYDLAAEETDRLGVARIAEGWDRQELVRRGLIPAQVQAAVAVSAAPPGKQEAPRQASTKPQVTSDGPHLARFGAVQHLERQVGNLQE